MEKVEEGNDVKQIYFDCSGKIGKKIENFKKEMNEIG